MPDEKGLQRLLRRLLAVKSCVAQQGRRGVQVNLGAAKIVGGRGPARRECPPPGPGQRE
jgi:hypothetical protein